ncbi:MAG: LuxR C-terminal-related transcriptional regulator [Flavobacterium sp.]|uniref:helix-turn-helix transcriptional regulator n=1 Tax=Flavobacterium sp. TaxID=239 RepID=UPI0025BB0654|nr:LuxR family transcriptional regulator [Flavobacterium sp.]MCA1967027.1 LuxR C-terminal-related transcriptional regulator [Flavobacterium sp.]
MIKKHFPFLLLVLFVFTQSFGQSEKLKKLENQIKILNDNLQYEKSIAVLNEIIINEQSTHYEKYYAYLLESFTHKRLFNYTKTLHKLDLALAEGLQSDHKEEVKNTIDAEKCFVYFDTQDYPKAEALIVHLRKINFKHLTIPTQSWIIMQDGYIKMLNKDYAKSEQLLNEAAALVKANSPENLPNIYGKKMELYNKMELFEKRDTAFKEGLLLAKKYNKVKYEMYLYQVMRNILQENEDYKNAFFTQKKYDSIVKYYNATDANGKLELAEKKLEDENRQLKEQNEKYIDYILYGVIISLLLLLYFAFRLYQSNMAKRILVEKENTRIHNEIERLTQALDEKGNATLNLSNYNLTDRQKEIIDFIRSGLTNKEIATKLFISENTVKYHLKIIYEILDIDHRSAIR